MTTARNHTPLNVAQAAAAEAVEIPFQIAGFLLARYPALLTARYGFKPEGMDAPGVLEAVARKRGCLIKGRGGELDIEKASLILLTDYRSGTLGRISLETPGSRAARPAAEAVASPADAAPDLPI